MEIEMDLSGFHLKFSFKLLFIGEMKFSFGVASLV